MGRGLGGVLCVLLVTLGATPSPTQILRLRNLSADLRYESQWSRFREDRRLFPSRRMSWGTWLEGRGFIYHRRFLSFYGRVFLEGERWWGQPVQRLAISRRSPYDLHLTFLAYRPVTLDVRAFRQVDTTTQSDQTSILEVSRVHQTLSAGLNARLARWPKLEARYERTSQVFETIAPSWEIRFQHWMIGLDQSGSRYRWTLRTDFFRYEGPEPSDTLQIYGTWSRVVGVPYSIFTWLQFWRDTTFFRVDFNRADEARQAYLLGTLQLTRMPDFLWLNEHGRYEWPLGPALRFMVGQAIDYQTFRAARSGTGAVQAGLSWGPSWQRWAFILMPNVSASYYSTSTGTGPQGLGYGAGLTAVLERSLGRGRLRWDAGGAYDFRPFGAGLETRSLQTGLSWTGFLVGRLHLLAFARWGWQETTAAEARTTIERPSLGVQLNWPRLRVYLRAETSATILNGVSYRQQTLTASLAPLRLGPAAAGLSYTLGRANDTRYRVGRGDLRWRVGRFQFSVVGSYYRTLGLTDRDGWDVRFLVQRPIPLIGGAERPGVYR
ncbi:MAG: hypothetical protein NZ742_05400 [Acidobacteria bacterium]|nr:hypothetical protein [Acidobacteriota bacterium]MDW7984497.1 hypothetical protein [Acidobacteriota bacterium]